MTLTYFEDLMDAFGAKTSGRSAFGAAHGYAFGVDFVQPNTQHLQVRIAVDGNPRAAARALNKKKIPYTKWAALPAEGGGTLEADYDPPSDFYAKSGLYTIFVQGALALREAGLSTPQACPLCGLGACDEYALLEGGYRPTHAACLQNRLSGPEEDVQPPTRVKGYVLTGILGALLGALIGALPIWAIAMAQNKLSWAMYVFIPFFSGLCYRLCRGKANSTVAGLSVLLSSVLVALALEQVWYWLWMTSKPEYGNLPFAFTVQDYFRTHNLGTTLGEMWLNLVALLVGFVAITFFLRRYAAEGSQTPPVRRGTRYIRATAQPMKKDGQSKAADEDFPDELDAPGGAAPPPNDP